MLCPVCALLAPAADPRLPAHGLPQEFTHPKVRLAHGREFDDLVGPDMRDLPWRAVLGVERPESREGHRLPIPQRIRDDLQAFRQHIVDNALA